MSKELHKRQLGSCQGLLRLAGRAQPSCRRRPREPAPSVYPYALRPLTKLCYSRIRISPFWGNIARAQEVLQVEDAAKKRHSGNGWAMTARQRDYVRLRSPARTSTNGDRHVHNETKRCDRHIRSVGSFFAARG